MSDFPHQRRAVPLHVRTTGEGAGPTPARTVRDRAEQAAIPGARTSRPQYMTGTTMLQPQPSSHNRAEGNPFPGCCLCGTEANRCDG